MILLLIFYIRGFLCRLINIVNSWIVLASLFVFRCLFVSLFYYSLCFLSFYGLFLLLLIFFTFRFIMFRLKDWRSIFSFYWMQEDVYLLNIMRRHIFYKMKKANQILFTFILTPMNYKRRRMWFPGGCW